MRKNILFLLTAGAILLTVSGCKGVGQAQNSNNNAAQAAWGGNMTTGTDENAPGTFGNINRVKLTLNDLVVGKSVMVMGSANQDGTVNAAQIMLGDLQKLGQGSRMGGATSTPQFVQRQSGQGTNGQQRQGGGNWQGNRNWQGQNGQGQNGGQQRPRMQGMTRVMGEILKKDTNSLVLKLGDGGSKIVFFSDKTEVFKMEMPTSTPAQASK